MPSFEDLLVHPYPCRSLPGLSLTNLTITARTPSLYFTDTRVYVNPAAGVYYKPLHVGLARPSPNLTGDESLLFLKQVLCCNREAREIRLRAGRHGFWTERKGVNRKRRRVLCTETAPSEETRTLTYIACFNVLSFSGRPRCTMEFNVQYCSSDF